MTIAGPHDPRLRPQARPAAGQLDDAQREAWEKAYGPKQEAFERGQTLTGDALVRWKYQRYLQDYLGCVAAVDESVGRMLDVLDEPRTRRRTRSSSIPPTRDFTWASTAGSTSA